MAKWPEAGRVKTRLCPPLSPEQAAGVHDLLLRHTLGRLADRDPILCFSPADRRDDFADRYAHHNVRLHPQSGGDLGDRLATLHRDLDKDLLVFGSDSPDVPTTYLAAALAADADVTLGPTGDGGYWCLGLRQSVDAADLLAGIPWSTGRELAATRDAADRLGLGVRLAPAWHDVDHYADLQALCRRLETQTGPAADLRDNLLRLVPTLAVE